ncbi:MAG: hypothetical protein ILA25_01835, partial [Prevotella sp.]|nr:hypothetical protein [Prevotella sp.]
LLKLSSEFDSRSGYKNNLLLSCRKGRNNRRFLLERVYDYNGDGHQYGYDNQYLFQDFFKSFPELDGTQTFLFEDGRTVFFMCPVVVMVSF